jgi:hypothetical protein
MGICSRMAMERYRGDAAASEAPLEGCLVITNRAVYELRPYRAAETVFFSLLAEAHDKAAAEALGKTVGLDLYQLYEAAADQVPARPRTEREREREMQPLHMCPTARSRPHKHPRSCVLI